MSDYSELKRLAEAIESCTSLPEKDEAAWMLRTTGRAVIELLEELENFQAQVPEWTEREITLIADKQRLEEDLEALRRDKSEPCDGCFMADAEALRKDAERYRWIRQYKFAVPHADALDAAVDGFMSKGDQP